jgi:hypothetical protein
MPKPITSGQLFLVICDTGGDCFPCSSANRAEQRDIHENRELTCERRGRDSLVVRTAPAVYENYHHDGCFAPSRRPVTVCGTI